MIRHMPRTPDYYASSHWLQWALVSAFLGVLAWFLLDALDSMQERAERQGVELTVRNMRTGMQLAMAEALMHQRTAEIATWAGSNPLRWLGGTPKGYRGECVDTGPESLSGGEWCFSKNLRQLFYRPTRPEHLRPVTGNDWRECSVLSWHVVRLQEGAVVDGGFPGLRLEPASGCHWILEER